MTGESFKMPENREAPDTYVKVEQLKHLCAENDDLNDARVAFARTLQKKYPDSFFHSELYHRLIGSTPPPGMTLSREDFPGEDSIEAFVNKKLQELDKEK